MVKLSLWVTKFHDLKTYWGVEIELHALLNWALDRGEWSASRPSRFTPAVRAPNTHCIGSSLGPRAGQDAVAKINKISSFPLPGIGPLGRPSRRVVTILTELSRLPVL